MIAKDEKADAKVDDTEKTEKKQDETVEGGDFIVGGKHVDSDGKEIGKKKA